MTPKKGKSFAQKNGEEEKPPRNLRGQAAEVGLSAGALNRPFYDKIVSANAEHKSAAKAQRMLPKLAEISVSVPLIMDLTARIGEELHAHLQQQAEADAARTLPPQYAEAPRLVAMWGGRRAAHDPGGGRTRRA